MPTWGVRNVAKFGGRGGIGRRMDGLMALDGSTACVAGCAEPCGEGLYELVRETAYVDAAV